VVEVDLGSNLPVTSELLKPYGVVAAYASTGKPVPELPYGAWLWKNPTLRQVFVYTMPDYAKEEAIADIASWVAAGDAQFAIAGRYPLAQAVEAHQVVERGGKIGQVIIDLP